MFFTVIPTKIDRGWKLILMNSVNRSVPSVVVRVMFRMLLAVCVRVAGPKPVDVTPEPGL